MTSQDTLQKRACYLRKMSTSAENYLWRYIRDRRFEKFKFRRQRPIGNYVADFICLWKKLIIEIDGGQHATQQDYDDKRTAFLQAKGYKVIRFWNKEVLTDIKKVLAIIWDELNSR